MRPRIGITTAFEAAEQRLDHRYVQAVENAGGLPLLMPMLQEAHIAARMVACVDGLLIPGGPAVSQGLLGRVPPELSATAPERSRSDIAMLDWCIEREVPVLGICYGMQLISARLGGTIYGDVERQVAAAGPHSDRRGASMHGLRIQSGTHLGRSLGAGDRMVNTFHLQAVAQPGEGLLVSARAPDGVIEGIENTRGSLVGVQFHPERMGTAMSCLFSDFVRRAACWRDQH